MSRRIMSVTGLLIVLLLAASAEAGRSRTMEWPPQKLRKSGLKYDVGSPLVPSGGEERALRQSGIQGVDTWLNRYQQASRHFVEGRTSLHGAITKGLPPDYNKAANSLEQSDLDYDYSRTRQRQLETNRIFKAKYGHLARRMAAMSYIKRGSAHIMKDYADQKKYGIEEVGRAIARQREVVLEQAVNANRAALDQYGADGIQRCDPTVPLRNSDLPVLSRAHNNLGVALLQTAAHQRNLVVTAFSGGKAFVGHDMFKLWLSTDTGDKYLMLLDKGRENLRRALWLNPEAETYLKNLLYANAKLREYYRATGKMERYEDCLNYSKRLEGLLKAQRLYHKQRLSRRKLEARLRKMLATDACAYSKKHAETEPVYKMAPSPKVVRTKKSKCRRKGILGRLKCLQKDIQGK